MDDAARAKWELYRDNPEALRAALQGDGPQPPTPLRAVTVFCGANPGSPDLGYTDLAYDVGRLIAARGYTLVYGGGRYGLMGAVARGAKENGGSVLGVTTREIAEIEGHPEFLTSEELTTLDHFEDRINSLIVMGDVCLVLPGGFGSMEELFRVARGTQVTGLNMPVGLINTDGYFDHLIAFIEHATAQGLIRAQHSGVVRAGNDAGLLLDELFAAREAGVHANLGSSSVVAAPTRSGISLNL